MDEQAEQPRQAHFNILDFKRLVNLSGHIMADEIINRRLKRVPTWAATQRLMNLQRTGVASRVVINRHVEKGNESWAEIHITMPPEKKETVLSLIKSLGL